MGYIKHKSEESMEDYLETILMLSRKKGKVRSIDIVGELGYTKASVSVAMKGLREKNLITMDEVGYIELTDAGLKKAEKYYSYGNVYEVYSTKHIIDSSSINCLEAIDDCIRRVENRKESEDEII